MMGQKNIPLYLYNNFCKSRLILTILSLLHQSTNCGNSSNWTYNLASNLLHKISSTFYGPQCKMVMLTPKHPCWRWHLTVIMFHFHRLHHHIQMSFVSMVFSLISGTVASQISTINTQNKQHVFNFFFVSLFWLTKFTFIQLLKINYK